MTQNKSFTYKTSEKRIMDMKIQAIKEGLKANELLDKILDDYLKEVAKNE